MMMNLKEQLTASLATPPQLVLPTKAHQTSSAPCVDTARAILQDSPYAAGGPTPSYLARFGGMGQSIYATSPMTPNGLNVEPSAFYPLGGVFPLRYERSDEMWKNMEHPAFSFPGAIDPMLASVHPYAAFYGGPLDLNNAARRKNATRETTSALKAWLYEHRKNPYPTKGEKIMLAIITKMTLTQVSTWFANARRRLKKESKLGFKEREADDSDVESVGSPCNIDEDKERNDSLSSGHINEDEDETEIKVTSDVSDISDAESEKEDDNSSNYRTMDDGKSASNENANIQMSTNQNMQSRLSAGSDDVRTQQPRAAEMNASTARSRIWSIDSIMNKSPPRTPTSSHSHIQRSTLPPPPTGIQSSVIAHASNFSTTNSAHAPGSYNSRTDTDSQTISESSIIKLSYRKHQPQVALNLVTTGKDSSSPKRTGITDNSIISESNDKTST